MVGERSTVNGFLRWNRNWIIIADLFRSVLDYWFDQKRAFKS